MVPPTDYVVFRGLVAFILAAAGWTPIGLVAIFLGHCLKWPPAVVE
jgi:hypothetical protein